MLDAGCWMLEFIKPELPLGLNRSSPSKRTSPLLARTSKRKKEMKPKNPLPSTFFLGLVNGAGSACRNVTGLSPSARSASDERHLHCDQRS